MARIRSVHPGIFTDPEFVGLSDSAQIFFIGLWTEADDFGAFEWKPITLKLRLRGGTNSPVDPLLEELSAADRIRQYLCAGKSYGAIRNFCRYQRPKFPKSIYFIPDDMHQFVGMVRNDSGNRRPSSTSIPEIDRDGDPPSYPFDGNLDSDGEEKKVRKAPPVRNLGKGKNGSGESLNGHGTIER